MPVGQLGNRDGLIQPRQHIVVGLAHSLPLVAVIIGTGCRGTQAQGLPPQQVKQLSGLQLQVVRLFLRRKDLQ